MIKLDTSKGFDIVSWVYLLELLQQWGFPTKWIDWLAVLLRTLPLQFSSMDAVDQELNISVGCDRGTRSHHTSSSWQSTR
jgi:hypothetical protein